MSENNEKENSSSNSTPLPLLRNFSNSSNDLPPSTILLHKRTNSALPSLNSGVDFTSSSILNAQTNSDSHSVEFHSQNLLENELTRRKSVMSNSSAKMSVQVN
jgi:hypothetical protein